MALPMRSIGRCVSLLVWLAALGSNGASAQSCGQEGARPCNVWERIPSCNTGLVEAGAKCLQPSPCGTSVRCSNVWSPPKTWGCARAS